MLAFDAKTLEMLDASYRGADITRRRLESFSALAPRTGERVLDLGCGQGLMTDALAQAVGGAGAVIGIDPSAEMRREAEVRCAGFPQVSILDGAAGSLPVEDGSLDAAVALQVFEYLDDIPGALADLRRALRPGARLVIGDMQWSTLSWASDDPERMERMCGAWERHVAEPDTPALLPHAFEAAGIQCVELRPVPFVSVHLGADSLPMMLMHLMRAYAVQNDLLLPDEAAAWFDGQERRAEAGRFFFSLTHFIAIGIRR